MPNKFIAKIFKEETPAQKETFLNEDFEFAGLGVRLLARILDNMILLLATPIVLVEAFAISKIFGIGIGDHFLFDISVYGVCAFALRSIYFALFHHFYGQTPGKRMFGLKVINENGENLSLGMSFYREMVGMLLVERLYYLPALSILFTKQHISVGDFLVDCRVVKTESSIAKYKSAKREAEYAEFLEWQRDVKMMPNNMSDNMEIHVDNSLTNENNGGTI